MAGLISEADELAGEVAGKEVLECRDRGISSIDRAL
jgi:hypothetical protein